MALSFDTGARKKRDQMIAIDLGSRTTKAVHLQRRGNGLALTSYALLDAPIYEKTLSADLLSEHLKAVVQALGTKTKLVTVAVSMNESLVRHVDMPRIPVDEMRQALKFNTKSYLQQDLPNYVFDCWAIPPRNGATEAPKNPSTAQKQKVLIAGAKKQLVDDFIEATKSVGLSAEQMVPSLICPGNAFEKALPEVFTKEAIAIVDVGFKSSFICILQDGEFSLSRVVTVGGDRFTAGLADSMNISYAEAEGIKLGMAHEVQPQIEAYVSPLGRELRASIDFFEHQNDRAVSSVYISGGSSRSDLILQALQTELMVECKTWDPLAGVQLSLQGQQASEITQVGSQFAVALGAAFAAF